MKTVAEVQAFAKILPSLEPSLPDNDEYWELFAFRIIDHLEKGAK